MNAMRAAVAVLALVLVATPVLAHVPSFPEDNTSPDRAVVVPDATKSWSFYDRLAPGQARYYRFSLSAGQRLRVGAFTPERGRFAPAVVLASPSLDRTGELPPGVTVPEEMGAVVVEGTRPGGAAYEPFAPSANYHTVDVDRRVETDRTYLVAVYEPANRSGPVGVTVGYREAFSPAEYLAVPFDLVGIRLWAGQGPLVVFGPLGATLLAGAALLRGRRGGTGRNAPVRYGIGAGALLLVGSAAGTLLQMGLALSRSGPTAGALVTAVLVVVPLLGGGWALWVGLRSDSALTARTRVGLAVVGAAGLATWGGFVVGPALLFVVAALPSGLVDRSSTVGQKD